MFGVGLGIQMARARVRGDRRFARAYVWRQFLLGVIGLAHALLLWFGDILATYAIVGTIALGVALLGPGWVRGVAIGGLTWTYGALLGLLVFVAAFGALFPDLDRSPPGERLSTDGPPISLLHGEESFGQRFVQFFSTENQVRVYRHGNFGDQVENRAAFFLSGQITLPFLMGWYILACFLIGILLLRSGLFHVADRRRRLKRRLVLLGLGVGVPLHVVASVLYLVRPSWVVAMTFLNVVGALPQALLYLALLLAWDDSGALPRLQAAVRALGRMALTNYLLQSVLCVLVFYNFGLGLYGRTGVTGALVVMLAIWVLELTWSPLWLRYFRMGPVEWAWRTLAGARPRLRAGPTVGGPA
jgi:uncharacterized protein